MTNVLFASMKLPVLAADPTGTEGDTYFNSGTDKQRVHTGVAWTDAAGASSPAVQKIGDFTLSGTTILRYDSIPQTFTHLRVVARLNSSRASFANTGGRFIFNTVAAGYSFRIWGGATTGGAANGYFGQQPAGSKTTTSHMLDVIIDVPYYTLAVAFIKQAITVSSGHDGTNMLADMVSNAVSCAAITRIDLFDDVLSALGPNVHASLYGIL